MTWPSFLLSNGSNIFMKQFVRNDAWLKKAEICMAFNWFFFFFHRSLGNTFKFQSTYRFFSPLTPTKVLLFVVWVMASVEPIPTAYGHWACLRAHKCSSPWTMCQSTAHWINEQFSRRTGTPLPGEPGRSANWGRSVAWDAWEYDGASE